jgi:hypothetical protein
MTDNSGMKYWNGICQSIEGVNVYDLIGKPVAFSFVFSASMAGVYSVAVRDGGTYSYVTSINVATPNTPQLYKILAPAIPLGASIPRGTAAAMSVCIGAINLGAYQTSTLNAWQSGNYFVANGFTNWGLTANATISATLLQLEAGSVATPFERRSYGHELTLCQRYYQIVDSLSFWGMGASGAAFGGSMLTFVPLRSSPTLGVGSWAYGNSSGGTANASSTHITAYATASSAAGASFTANALTLSAEL